MKNSKWNKYEAALLIDGYKRVVNGHASIKEVAMRISERIILQVKIPQILIHL